MALLDEIERADAWSFTSRPQDLQEVIDFWKSEKRIGTRLELMRKSIDRRLTERDERRGAAMPISSAKAREGARLAAATATLTKNRAIRVPDGAENANGISLRAVLPDWDNRLQNTLLSFPIFDNAIYGTVRFHHRPVQEYLTAEWFNDFLSQPVSRRAVEGLFFQEKFGIQVIVPAMRPILPWLAILNDRIRERVRAVAPELILEGGDPSALPLPVRKMILAEVCEMLADQKSLRDNATDYSAVQRFANVDIADDIRRLMNKHASSDDVAGFLVRMIWLGRLEMLLPDAKLVALDPQSSTYTRVAAFRAMRAIGTSADQREVREAFLSEAPALKREWLGELLRDVQPTEELSAWLLDALEKVEPKERYSVDRLAETITAYVRAAKIELLPSFIKGLLILLGREPVIETGFCQVSQLNDWLLEPAVVATERLVAVQHQYALQVTCLEVMHKFMAARHWKDDLKEIKEEFSKSVSRWTELNRAAFWYDVHAARRRVEKKPGERLTHLWQASLFGSFWKFGASDFDYAIDAVSTQVALDDKLVALSLAHAIYIDNGKVRHWRDRLRRVASEGELAMRLDELLNPPRQHDEYRRKERRWKRQAEERTRRKAEQYEKSKTYILANTDGLRDPKLKRPTDISKAQWYLHEELRNNSKHSSSRWTEGKWRELVPAYGEEVANAYRDGVIAYWRRHRPPLRSEGAAANTTPISIVFGLSGIAIEAKENENWPHYLSDDDVELAARYALHELNGFPVWFPALFAARSQNVARVLLQELEYELSTENPDQESHYVLSDLSWSGEWAWNFLAPHLLQILKEREPSNASNLRKLLKIIQGSVTSDEELEALAEAKCSQILTLQTLGQWFAVWVGVAPACSIRELAARLAALQNPEDQTTLAMFFITHLWAGRRTETNGARTAFHAPAHIKDIYLLMHKYIRRAEDINRPTQEFIPLVCATMRKKLGIAFLTC